VVLQIDNRGLWHLHREFRYTVVRSVISHDVRADYENTLMIKVLATWCFISLDFRHYGICTHIACAFMCRRPKQSPV